MTPVRRMAVAIVAVVGVLGLAGCEHLIVPPADAPLRYRDAVFADVEATSDITYGTAVDQEGETVTLELDLYEPLGDAVTERPLVVFVHGGGFAAGDKSSPEIVDQARYLARRGYVAASISYRLVDGGCGAAGPTASCVTAILHAREDAQDAIRFLRAEADTYDIDTSRVAVAGTSAGGITAMEVAFDSAENPDAAVTAGVSLSGAHLLTSPGEGDGATLLFHGTDDALVPYDWAVNTRDSAKANDVRSILVTWDGEGHVPYVAHRTEILEQTRNFLYWHLGLTDAAR